MPRNPPATPSRARDRCGSRLIACACRWPSCIAERAWSRRRHRGQPAGWLGCRCGQHGCGAMGRVAQCHAWQAVRARGPARRGSSRGRCRWHRRGRSVDGHVRGDRCSAPRPTPRRPSSSAACRPGCIALGLLAGLAVIGAAWAVTAERPAVAVALAVTSAGLLVPTWAGTIVLPPAAQAGALATAPLAVAGVSQVGLRWSRAVGPSGPTRVIYALAFAAVIVLGRRLRSPVRPRMQPHLRARPSPAGRLRFDPDRVPDRDGPHRVGRHPGDRRARPGGARRAIRRGRSGHRCSP